MWFCEKANSTAMSRLSLPSRISVVPASAVNIAPVLARLTTNMQTLQWQPYSVEQHLAPSHWPQGLTQGSDLSINRTLLGWDGRLEDYDRGLPHVYNHAQRKR